MGIIKTILNHCLDFIQLSTCRRMHLLYFITERMDSWKKSMRPQEVDGPN